MKDRFKNTAMKYGIEKVGFTKITNMQYLEEMLKYKEINSFSCSFEKIDIAKRIDAKKTMGNCSTIISFLFPYGNGYNPVYKSEFGNISITSYGIDYHKMVRDKLELVCREIKKTVEFNYEICVDTSPLVDRAVCYNSGLGFIGKNSMLINEKYGSLCFLGYVLTDLNMDIEESRVGNKCGNCSKCIDSCPNSAIMDNSVINSNRCISYLTQSKEYIPLEFREKMGSQIYGCDVCQVSCPHNKGILDNNIGLDYSQLNISLDEIFKLTKSQFEKKYKYLAGSWRGLNIWKRNAIIVCANRKYNRFYDTIKDCVNLNNNMFKTYGAWALIKMDKINGKQYIFDKIKYEDMEIAKEYKKLLEVL